MFSQFGRKLRQSRDQEKQGLKLNNKVSNILTVNDKWVAMLKTYKVAIPLQDTIRTSKYPTMVLVQEIVAMLPTLIRF
jgi:glutathione synthase/RimK-type ligase-like ATP-grasp enzyme